MSKKEQILEEAAEKYATIFTDKKGHKIINEPTKEILIAAQYAFPRWISVDEKLPEMDEIVIVLIDEHNTAPICKIGLGKIVDVERYINYNGWNIPGVKYWMPCPEMPNND